MIKALGEGTTCSESHLYYNSRVGTRTYPEHPLLCSICAWHGDVKKCALSYLEFANATKIIHIAYSSAQDVLKGSVFFPLPIMPCVIGKEKVYNTLAC